MKSKSLKLNKYFRLMIYDLEQNGWFEEGEPFKISKENIMVHLDWSDLENDDVGVEVAGADETIPLKAFPKEIATEIRGAFNKINKLVVDYIRNNVNLSTAERKYILSAYERNPEPNVPALYADTDEELNAMGIEADKRLRKMLNLTLNEIKEYENR